MNINKILKHKKIIITSVVSALAVICFAGTLLVLQNKETKDKQNDLRPIQVDSKVISKKDRTNESLQNGEPLYTIDVEYNKRVYTIGIEEITFSEIKVGEHIATQYYRYLVDGIEHDYMLLECELKD